MSNDNISKTITQYKEWSQLAEFAQAQMTTITSLSKKNQKLEDEVKHLKTLLESVPTTAVSTSVVEQFALQDAEFICNMEIGKLKGVSLVRELTYEETKKLAEYFKILNQFKDKPLKEKEVEKLSDQELLKLVAQDGTGK